MLLDRKVNVLWVMNAAAVAATATWFVSMGLVFTDKTETSEVVKSLLASHEAVVKRIASRAGPQPLVRPGTPLAPRQELAVIHASRACYATYLALLALANAEAGYSSGPFEKYSVKLPRDEELKEVFAGHPAAIGWVESNYVPLLGAIEHHQAADERIRNPDQPRKSSEEELARVMARRKQYADGLLSMYKEVEALEAKRERLAKDIDELRKEIMALREEREKLRQQE